MSPCWLAGWAVLLAIGWLLPNHYPPWTAFHLDAWVGVAMAVSCAAVILRARGNVGWHGITVVTALLVFVPLLQYAFGLVLLSGTAWVGTTYLCGFLLVLICGAQWESSSPGELADGLFLAIGIASIISVGLQLHQWFDLDVLDIWAMGGASARPFANIGQPNELGTLLLWGLLAAAWGVATGRLGAGTALVVAVYLLFGLALTKSRTAWITIAMLVLASWGWRKYSPSRLTPFTLTALGLYFGTCVVGLDWLRNTLLLSAGTDSTGVLRLSGELRPQLWLMMADAAIRQPWFGYGWNQVASAQLLVGQDYPSINTLTFHSHNLFLDFVLWCGIPVGLLLSAYLVRWTWHRFRKVKDLESAILVLFLLVVLNHAMLELPLHHAYFLLPAGMVMGMLNVRLATSPVQFTGRWFSALVWLTSTTLLAIIISDYLRVETSYKALRFEWNRIEMKTKGTPPDVIMLNQQREFIRFARFEPTPGMSEADLEWMRKVTTTFPNTGTVHNLATALALNRRPDEARQWLRRVCYVVSKNNCELSKEMWAKKSRENAVIGAIPWPD